MPLGSASLNGGGFDPAGLALTGYWRAPFNGAPWLPTCGTYSLVNNVGNATIGAAVNGIYTPAAMVDTPICSGLIGSAGSTADQLFTNTAASGWALIKLNAFTPTNSSQIITFNNSDGQSASNFFVLVSNVGSARAQFAGIGGSNHVATHPTNITTGAWHLLQFAFTDNWINFRVDGNAWVTTTIGASDPMKTYDVQKIGIGDSGGNAQAFGNGVNGSLLEAAVTNYVIDQATFDQIRAYCNGKYGVSV